MAMCGYLNVFEYGANSCTIDPMWAKNFERISYQSLVWLTDHYRTNTWFESVPNFSVHESLRWIHRVISRQIFSTCSQVKDLRYQRRERHAHGSRKRAGCWKGSYNKRGSHAEIKELDRVQEIHTNFFRSRSFEISKRRLAPEDQHIAAKRF
jgi:hypothetical protein